MPKLKPKHHSAFRGQRVFIEFSDGSVMNGYVFVEATLRIQDVLNSAAPFLPFVDEEDVVHLVNKSAIVRVRPYDQ